MYFVYIYVFVTTIHRLSKFIAAINSVSLFIYPRYFSVFMVVINRLIFSWSGQHLDVYIVSNGLPNKYFDQTPAKHQPSNFSCTAEVIEQSNYRLENYIHSMYTEKLIKGCKRINEKMCSIA